MKENKVIDALLGLAVGDALGVPVEFMARTTLQRQPVTDMQGYGTHHQPPGTWSDDSSLAFCLAESLCNGYDLTDMATRFVNWQRQGYWAAHGTVFDIGMATSVALQKIATGTNPVAAGGTHEQDNGNGSLMRILPAIFYTKGLKIQARFEVINAISSLTHSHIRSIFACFLYTEYALLLLNELDKKQAFSELQRQTKVFLAQNTVIDGQELNHFHRLLEIQTNPGHTACSIDQYAEAEIASSGYVVHTLEAAFWCFLTTDTYAEAVLKAVNLGSDTDTTACVTGGLAGLYYGASSIPEKWVNALARKDEIVDLANRLNVR